MNEEYEAMKQKQALQELEELKKKVLLNVLTKEARERLSTLKTIKPEVANQIEMYIVQLYQSGQLKRMLTENDLKMILNATQEKKDFKITRK